MFLAKYNSVLSTKPSTTGITCMESIPHTLMQDGFIIGELIVDLKLL